MPRAKKTVAPSPGPVGDEGLLIEEDPQPDLVALFTPHAGPSYRLGLFTWERYNALTVGAVRRLNFVHFGPIGMLSVIPVDGEDHANTCLEMNGLKPQWLSGRRASSMALREGRDGDETVLALLDAAKCLGVRRATSILRRANEEAGVAADYFTEAFEADDLAKPEPARGFRVMVNDLERSFNARPGLELDQVIADAIAQADAEETNSDLTVWFGSKLLASIVRGPDGKAIIARFDG